MAFHTPHASARYRLPWSWSSFDYRELCRELWAQSGDARFEIAPGSVGVLPPGVIHDYQPHGRAEHLYAHFSPREQAGDTVPILALQDLGPDFSSFVERFEHAVHVFRTRPAHGGQRRPGIDTVDAFLESLARERGAQSIAVVLSGTGQDGTAGAVCVKQAGGVVLVQDPLTAMHDSMPRSVIANSRIEVSYLLSRIFMIESRRWSCERSST